MSAIKLSSKERKRIKYAEIRSQKAQKSLLVVDNEPLRVVEIRKAKSWLKKIDRLDETIERYYSTDSRLFSDWHDLTFRDLNETLRKKREEYTAYAQFHNKMVFIANSQYISIPRAYRILREEEAAYQRGDEAIKSKIDELRAKRRADLEQ